MTKNGKIIRSIHPPDSNLILKIKDEVIATPYRKDNNRIETVIEHNNFTNLNLQSIGKH